MAAKVGIVLVVLLIVALACFSQVRRIAPTQEQPSAVVDTQIEAQDADPRAAPEPLLDPNPFTAPAR